MQPCILPLNPPISSSELLKSWTFAVARLPRLKAVQRLLQGQYGIIARKYQGNTFQLVRANVNFNAFFPVYRIVCSTMSLEIRSQVQEFSSDCLADVELKVLASHLVDKGVISNHRIDEYLSLPENSVQHLTTLLLELIQQGTPALERFYTSLKAAGYEEQASTLQPKLEELIQVDANNDDEITPSGPPFSAVGVIDYIDGCCLSRQKSLVEEEEVTDELDIAAVEERSNIEKVLVKEAEFMFTPQDHRIYPMRSRPKGYALIIVNQEFERGLYTLRLGAEKDHENLMNLFEGLGYEVFEHRNKTSLEMRKILRAFAEMPAHEDVDSCVVAISTHGEPNRLVGSDCEYVFVEDILDLFNNESCPFLMTKPKLFFIQACRGGKLDRGVRNRNVADSGMLRNASLLEPIQRSPSWTDMTIAYSTIPGFAALRNEERGSWFITAVTRVFMENAWNTPLSRLFQMVSEEMEAYATWDGEKQAPEIAHRGWKRDLYFNPGLYNET